MANQDSSALELEALTNDEDVKQNETSIVASLRTAVFKTIHGIAQDFSIFWPALVILWVFDIVQVLYFPLSAQAGMPWATMPLMSEGIYLPLLAVSIIPGASYPLLSSPHSSSLLSYPVLSLFLFGMVWSALTLALFGWSVLAHMSMAHYNPAWLLRLLRLLCLLSLHGLFIPVLSSLLSPLTTTNNINNINGTPQWLNTGISVFSGGHVACLIVGLLLAVAFIAVIGLVALLAINRVADPSGKKNILAASHGRVSAGHVACKVVLCLVWATAGATDALPGWGYIIITTALVALMVILTLRMLPFFHMWLNQLQACLLFMVLAACAAAMLALAVGQPEYNAGGIVLLMLLPVAAYAGYTSASIRWKSFDKSEAHSRTQELSSPFMAELRMRFILLEALAGVDSAGNFRIAKPHTSAAEADVVGLEGVLEDEKEDATLLPQTTKSTRRGFFRDKDKDDSKSVAGTTTRSAIGKQSSDAVAAKGRVRLPPGLERVMSAATIVLSRIVPYASKTVGVAAAALALPRGHPALSAIDDLFNQASTLFSGSAMLDVMIAHYLGNIKQNRHLERVHLRSAESKAEQSAIDVHFFVWQRLQQIDSEEEAKALVKMTVVKRMQFEAVQLQSQSQVQNTRLLILQFWSILQEKHPDLKRLSTTGVQINRLIAETQQSFKKLLEMAPQSASVMRSYAEFLLELANDPRKGMELLADAEQIEDEQSRSHAQAASETEILLGMIVPDFDLSGETASILRISGQAGSVGTITDVNITALKLFGYNKREVVGRDINVLVPEPIAAVHPMFLDKYMDDGQETIINTSRVYFLVHRAGYIFPARVNVRPMGDEWAAVCEEIATPMSFVWFTGADTNWRVTASCRNAMDLLGIDVPALRAGAVSMQRYLSDPAAEVRQMGATDEGTLIVLRNVNVDGSRSRRPKSVLINAKLQAMAVPFLNTAIYIVRFRRANNLEMEKMGFVARSDSIIDEEDEAGSQPSSPREHSPTAASEDGASIGSMSAGHSEGSAGSGHGSPLASSLLNMSKHNLLQSPHGSKGGDISLCPVMRSKPVQNGSQNNGSLHLDANTSDRHVGFQSHRAQQQSGSNDNLLGTNSAEQDSPTGSPTGMHPETLIGVSSALPDEPEPAENTSSSLRKPRGGSVGAATMLGPTRSASNFPQMGKSPHGSPHYALTPNSAGEGVDVAPRSHRPGLEKPSRAGSVDGKGSVHSRGSGTSATSVTEVLRRGVMARSHRLEGSLRTLKRAVMAIFVVIGIMNIASVVVTSTLMEQMQKNMKLVTDNGRRAKALQTSYATAQELVLFASRKLDFEARGGLNATEAWMSRNLDTFEVYHRELYLLVDGSLDEETQLYTNTSVLIEDLVPGTYVSPDRYNSTFRYINFANAGLEFLAKARQFLSFNATQRTRDVPIAFWLDTNGWRGIRDAANHSMMLADARSQTQGTTMHSANYVVLAIALVLLVFVAVLVMVPSVVFVSRAQKSIFEVFLDVPVPIVRALRNRTYKKVLAIKRAAEENDVGLDVGGRGEVDEDVIAVAMHRNNVDDEDDAPVRRVTTAANTADENDGDGVDELQMAINTVANKLARDRAAAAATENGGRKTGCCGGSAKKTGDKSTRHYRRASSERTIMLVKMTWPILVYIVYYIGTFFWKQMAVDDAVHTKSETLWSSQVDFYVPQALFGVRQAYRTCDPIYTSYAIYRAKRAVRFMDSLLDGLLYGDDVRLLRPGLQRSPDIAYLFMNNGCVENRKMYYALDDCRNVFMDGLIRKAGLRAALSEYLQRVQQALTDREHELTLPTCDFRRTDLGELGIMSELGEKYLPPAFSEASRLFYSQGLNEMQHFHDADMAVTVISVLLLFVLYAFVYQPTISALDREIKDCRGLLLLFPDEVARAVPAIINAGKDMLKDAGSSAGSAISR